MIIFREIDIKNYRNIKHAELKDLRDLNIIIGPNNCGKTNLLEFIWSFRNMASGRAYSYLCQECKKFEESNNDIECLYLPLVSDDFYLKEPNRTKIIVSISLDEQQIDQLIPRVLKKQKEKLNNAPCREISNNIVMESESQGLLAKHFSIFIHDDIIEELKGNILYCPEKRLQSYKERDFAEYVREKELRSSQKKKWVDFLSRIIDTKIEDEKYETLIRKVDGEDFETPISEQGSGVRSLACLAVDILFGDDKIVLIDEPELGLNPLVKQEFLKFLLTESKERQIFIATQDPTFVNPILWKNENNRISVYFFTPIEEKFIKINLEENPPEAFAGYLPHTTSLKDFHIYVEGISDVYVFQILLSKFLQNVKKQNWFEIENKIGIFHLAGNNWGHFLYTIPKPPYKCMIILDGDKKKKAEEVVRKYNKSNINASKFKVCNTLDEVREVFEKRENHPLYCLKENCVERYLFPNFDCSNPPENYKKTKDGPKAAEELNELPTELKELFEVILYILELNKEAMIKELDELFESQEARIGELDKLSEYFNEDNSRSQNESNTKLTKLVKNEP